MAVTIEEYVEDYYTRALKAKDNLLTFPVARVGKQPVLESTLVFHPNDGDIQEFLESRTDVRVDAIPITAVDRALVRSDNPREGILFDRVETYRDAYDSDAFLPLPVYVLADESLPSGEQRYLACDGSFLNRGPYARAFFAYTIPSLSTAEKLELYAMTNSTCGTPYTPNAKLWLVNELYKSRGISFKEAAKSMGINSRTTFMGHCGLMAVEKHPKLRIDKKSGGANTRALTSIGERISMLGTGYTGSSTVGAKRTLNELTYEEIEVAYAILSRMTIHGGQAARDFFGKADSPRDRLSVLIAADAKRSLNAAATGHRTDLADDEALLLSATYIATNGGKVRKLFPKMTFADQEMVRRAHAVLDALV